jgi:hypothetical protein
MRRSIHNTFFSVVVVAFPWLCGCGPVLLAGGPGYDAGTIGVPGVATGITQPERLEGQRVSAGLTVLGIVIGLAGAVVASHAIVTLLFGVSRLDPVTYLGVVGLLLGVSAIACSVPAWRAALVDHSITLRAE